MARAVKLRFFARRTRAERVRQRAKIVLRDAGITEKTQSRYYAGLKSILPVLKKSKSLMDMDERVSDWIQERWEQGDSLHLVNDALCAIHHYMSLGLAKDCLKPGRFSQFGGNLSPQTGHHL